MKKQSIDHSKKPHRTEFHFDPEEELTEPEHADSCDINKIMKSIHRGQPVRAGSQPRYGIDDTTMSGLEFRIQKQKLETELAQVSETHEFSEEELSHIHPKVRENFKFKTRKKQDLNQGPQNQGQQNSEAPKTDPPKTDPPKTS